MVAEATVDDLAAALRVPVAEVEFLADTDPVELGVLVASIESAAADRDVELRDAVDGALGFIPRPLRGRVLKALGVRHG